MKCLSISARSVWRGIGKLSVPTMLLAVTAGLCWGQYRPRVMRVKLIQLPEPTLTGSISLEEALAKRRSVRFFTRQPLTFSQIGQLAWAGQGITEKIKGLRTAPSAGATFPIELYFATQDGLFVYKPNGHSLEQTYDQDVRGVLAQAVADQRVVAQAACDIVVAGSIKELRTKYRTKARQYMLLEAGHVAQNIQLQAVSLELGSVPVGGFSARDVKRACKLPRDLEPIYIICAGHPAVEEAGQGSTEETTGIGGPAGARPRRAAFIIPSQNFHEEELFETGKTLEEAGIETFIASSRTGLIRGMLGETAEATILLNELRVDDFGAIVLIGGSGAAEYIENPAAMGIIREAAGKRKVLGAIGMAPSLLANAGILNGVRATSFPSERGMLELRGAIFTGAAVERDGLIVTGSEPAAAPLFGQAIIDALTGR